MKTPPQHFLPAGRALQLLLLLGAAAIGFSGCEKCRDLEERSFTLRFYENGRQVLPPPYSKVYGLGGNGLIGQQDSAYLLPISVADDWILYVLERPQGGADTIEVTYKRSFRFQSERCGYTVDYGIFTSGPRTTFDEITIIGRERDSNFFFSFPEDVFEISVDL